MPTEQPLHCPVHRTQVTPCDPAELAPLLDHLRADVPVSDAVTFPRGTVTPDGRLDLCKQSLGPVGCRQIVDALEANTRIVSLMLGTDGIGDGGAADVARLVGRNHSVEVLYLGCNNIGPAGVAPLAEALSAPGVEVSGLWLKRNPLGAIGARRVAALIRRSSTLRVLDLVNTWPGDGLADLLDALTHDNRTVERVYLGGNGLGPADAPALASLLRAATPLRALMLSVGGLGEGALALAEGLRRNTTLEELSLASNGIGPAGTAALLDAAASHPSLAALDLGRAPSEGVLGAVPNRLGRRGVVAAARLIRSSHTLQTLDLRGTGTTEGDKDEFADALSGNTRLRRLLVDGPEHPRIARALEANRALAPGPQRPRDVALTRSVYRTV